MKKILSLALGATLVASLAVSASAAAVSGANVTAKTVKTEVKAAAATPVMDGKIGEYEYAKINMPEADLYYSEGSVKIPFEMYLCYDKDYLYYAIKTNHATIKQENDADMTQIWNSDNIQISVAKTDVTAATKANRTEFGYAKSSKTGNILYATWADGYKTNWKAAASDIVINVEKNGDAIYEGKVPAKAFGGVTELKKGDSYKFMAMVNSIVDGKRQFVEYATGCAGAVGKDATAHATITLGDAIELPKKAPETADATSVAVLALAASLAAGYVVAKKH
jgi:hypothetical protein